MKNKRKRVAKSTVAKYWLKKRVEEEWDTLTEESPEYPFFQKLVLQDWGEPSCWACGWWDGVNPELVDCTLEEAEHPTKFWKAWDRSSLEACHIVPHSRGWAGDPSNILLLCADCHSECCDVTNPKYMKLWVGAKKTIGLASMLGYSEKDIDETNKYIDLFGVTPNMLMAVTSEEHKEEFGNWYEDNVVSVSGQFKPSTRVAMIHQYCEERGIS